MDPMLHRPASPSSTRTALLLGAMLMALMSLSHGDDAGVMSAAIRPDLTDAQCRELEKTMASTPGDVPARARLIGYYFTHPSPMRFPHVLWMIEHEPASRLAGSGLCSIMKIIEPENYAAGAKLWSAHLAADTVPPKILLNAADFFMISDKEACERILRRGLAAFPSDADFPDKLAHLYRLQKPTMDAQALEMYEKALSLAPDGKARFYLLCDVAKTAIDAAELHKAKDYANELLTLAGRIDDWNTGNAVFAGNMVLGQIAVREEDLDAACALLLKAGRTKGSPQLDSFGPNMSLAKELFERGRTHAVLEFLDLCSEFWKRPELSVWKSVIMAGGTPDFGHQLN